MDEKLFLNQEPLPGFDHQITLLFSIAQRDMSGGESGTAVAYSGHKPCSIGISLKIYKEHPKELAALRQLFQEVENGPKAYSVFHPTLRAAGITKARFSEQMRINTEDQSTWKISLHMAEVSSIPERKEVQRKKKAANPPTETKTPAEPQEGNTANDSEDKAPWKPEGFLEEGLASLDGFFGKFFEKNKEGKKDKEDKA